MYLTWSAMTNSPYPECKRSLTEIFHLSSNSTLVDKAKVKSKESMAEWTHVKIVTRSSDIYLFGKTTYDCCSIHSLQSVSWPHVSAFIYPRLWLTRRRTSFPEWTRPLFSALSFGSPASSTHQSGPLLRIKLLGRRIIVGYHQNNEPNLDDHQ